MTVVHIAGQILWYSFLGIMCVGLFIEFREHQERLKHRTPNIGRRAASLSKRGLQYHRQIARTAPAIAVPIVAKPRSHRVSVPRVEMIADPVRTDVVSTLKNLGWKANEANAAYAKSTGTGFDERLKSSLAVACPQRRSLRLGYPGR